MLEEEKKKLIKEINKVRDYKWDRVQSDYMLNNYGTFLFKILKYDELIRKIRKVMKGKNLPQVFKQYTINRWYNFACSVIVQSFFESHKRVTPERNKKSLTKDFFIDGNNFDMKITFIFKNWTMKRVLEELEDPKRLIVQFYKKGGAQRMHLKSKLFIVMVDLTNLGTHAWEMQREFGKIEKLVKSYLDNTAGSEHLSDFKFKKGDDELVIEKSDVLFLIKKKDGFYGRFFFWRKNLPSPIEINL